MQQRMYATYLPVSEFKHQDQSYLDRHSLKWNYLHRLTFLTDEWLNSYSDPNQKPINYPNQEPMKLLNAQLSNLQIAPFIFVGFLPSWTDFYCRVDIDAGVLNGVLGWRGTKKVHSHGSWQLVSFGAAETGLGQIRIAVRNNFDVVVATMETEGKTLGDVVRWLGEVREREIQSWTLDRR